MKKMNKTLLLILIFTLCAIVFNFVMGGFTLSPALLFWEKPGRLPDSFLLIIIQS